MVRFVKRRSTVQKILAKSRQTGGNADLLVALPEEGWQEKTK